MVKRQIVARGVRDSRVVEALTNVPRHWFVPASLQPAAYTDGPLPIGQGQTISQPYIVAFMTEALQLSRDSKVLEVGTGSGYQAAVLAEITPHVFTVEIVEPLARRAIDCFERYGYTTVKTRIGDGYAGWAEHAPFDAIIVTCAPESIPPKLIEQLKVGGRLCIPVGRQGGIQSLRRVTKTAEGKRVEEDLMLVRFVPMTGEARD
jgi:protein-L-isoaspartate(D-aspartate) O-methyltransferase